MIFQSYVIIIFSLSLSFPTYYCEANFFVADDNVNALVHNYRCLTNSSFALSWNDENFQDNLQQVSNYIPPLPETAFNCNIDEDMKTRNFFLKPPWSLKESLNSKINQIILDRRWEDMAIVTTKASRGLDNIYEPVLSNLENNFEIPISIRTESEAHLFLCDGADPTSSNCYWFMLQAFSGTQSAIRKCEKGYIPLRRNAYPKGSCQTKLTSIDHSKFPKYLSKLFWSHFKLEKKNNLLSLTKVDGNKMNIEILKLEDKSSVINVTHMIVHSKKLNTLWKIHQTSFIYTDKETSELKLGPLLDSIEDTICISMFLTMCQNCKLKLALTKNNKINKEEVYKVEGMEWLEIKFLVENIKGDKFSLLVSTIGGSSDRFWAIDKVRQCQKHEFRLIGFNGFNKSPLCQLMDADKNVIPNARKFFTPSDITCSEDTIGEFCVPCSWIYPTCEKIIVCSKQQASDGEATCTCSAGYQNYNNCFFKCNPGYYGHGCQKKCGKCFHQCNPIHGSCSFCTSNYTGPKCNIPPSIIFKNAPQISKIGYTEATVKVTNFELQEILDIEMNLFYSIEYTVEDPVTQNWFSVDMIQKFYDSTPIKMGNLKPDTSYSVRALVIIKEKNITYHNDLIPVSAFTTKCQDIVQNNIFYLKPSNTSVNISIKSGTTNAPCKLNKYVVTLLDGVYPMLANENYIHFEKLVPYTNYTVMIQRGSNIYQKSFKTTEGVPELVQNLTISNVSGSSVQIQWQRPPVIFGKLKNYVLELQLLYFIACKSHQFESKDKRILKVNNTSVTIDELIPFSKYSLSVFAVNAKFEGKRQIVEFTTQHSETIQLEEFPQITEVLTESKSVTVKMSRVNCSKIRGPIFVPATLACTNVWCKNYTVTKFVEDFQLTFTQLYPFSNYTLTLSFCRSSTICNNFTRHVFFKTKPSAPSMVINLTVFSKSKNSISLRWMPPYPPTGILRFYRIGSSSFKYEEIVLAKNSSCGLWPKFQCATLSNLDENKKYEILISARNDIPTNFGPPNSVIGITKTEPSEAPYDLNLFWSRTNDLVLNWKHPNQSNGAIKYFNISIIPKSSGINKIEKQIFVDDNTYSLIYYYKIGAKDLAPSTSYIITISAYNDHFGKELTTTVTSPPDIPSLYGDPQTSSTNHTITLQLSTKQPKGFYNYSLILLVSDQSNESIKFSDLGNFQIHNFRIVSKCNLTNFNKPVLISIGDGKQLQNCDQTINNPSLNPGKHYNITVFLINTFQEKTRYKNISLCINTGGKSTIVPAERDFNFLYLLVLILILPLAVCLFVLRHKLGEACKSEKTTEIPLVMSETRHSNRRIGNNRNTISKVFSKAVPLGHFEEYMKKCKTNGELERQHSMVFNYPVTSIYEAADGGLFFDYVDMEFADGTNIPKAYIVSDIPKTSCIDDFWKILWEENVKYIVLLADSQVKKYWPEINEKKTCHDITVQLAFSNKLDHYFYRKFILFRHDQIKQVEQIHFEYCGLNPQKFVPLFSKTLKLSLETSSPVLFHSNSLRETGLVLMCDMSLRIAKEERVIDVLKILNKLSYHTSSYVDNVEQYKLAHFIIWEYVFGDCKSQTTDYVNF